MARPADGGFIEGVLKDSGDNPAVSGPVLSGRPGCVVRATWPTGPVVVIIEGWLLRCWRAGAGLRAREREDVRLAAAR